MSEQQPVSLVRARLWLLLAAVLWSTSGSVHQRAATKHSILNLNHPVIHPVQIACFRVLFAGLALTPTLRRRHFRFRPLMIFMVLAFAVMNASFVFATGRGTAAKAIFLQYTAPMWMYLASLWFLGEKPERRSTIALIIGMLGIGIIIFGSVGGSQLRVVLISLMSGFLYACVVICLRAMRDVSSQWLTFLNHFVGGLIILPYALWIAAPAFSSAQWVVLFVYGTLQMGLPYLLAARSLHVLSPQEAGTITLIEPVLNPVLAYLISSEKPSEWTVVGGIFILGALAWRYWPRRGRFARPLPEPTSLSS